MSALNELDTADSHRLTQATASLGIAPVSRNHPAYPYMRDGGGMVCE